MGKNEMQEEENEKQNYSDIPTSIDAENFIGKITRRQFVKQAGAAAAGAFMASQTNSLSLLRLPTSLANVADALPSFMASVVRPDDMVALKFEFINMILDSSTAPGQIITTGSPSYIVVHLPPQNIAEEAFYEVPNTGFDTTKVNGETHDSSKPGYEDPSTPTDTPRFPGLVKSRISGWSRLVFQVPPSTKISYTLHDILSTISTYDLNVTATALPTLKSQSDIPTPPPSIVPPEYTETSLEVPYRLIVSPTGGHNPSTNYPYGLPAPKNAARWVHSSLPVNPIPLSQTLRTELWHTRLAIKETTVEETTESQKDDEAGQDEVNEINEIDETDSNIQIRQILSSGRIIRPIWSPDFYADQTGGNNPHSCKIGSPCTPTPSCKNPPGCSPAPSHYSSASGTNGEPDFRMSLDNRDRDEIVHLSANYGLTHYDPEKDQFVPYVPPAVSVQRLMLSSLGAWMDVDGTWENGPIIPLDGKLDVLEWRHLATMGRDHYVKVVYAGFLCPFGHRAALVKVTQRKIIAGDVQIPPFAPVATSVAATPVAYLKQRMFIVVRQPEVQYPSLGQGWFGRRTPYKSLRITSLVTPDLDDPTDPTKSSHIGSFGQDAFWPQTKENDFLFHFIGTDWEGNTSEFSMPLIFVSENIAYDLVTAMPSIQSAYNNDPRRKVLMSGQRIAFADPTRDIKVEPNTKGKTSFETSTIYWAAELFDKNNIAPDDPNQSVFSSILGGKDLPPFYPMLDQADIRVSAIDELSGVSDPTKPTTIAYHGGPKTGYLWNGFSSANAGEVFAKLVNGYQLDLSSSVQKVGGLATPSMNIVGLSRMVGTVSGDASNIDNSLNEFMNGNWNPLAAFNGLLDKAKILGGIPLSSIIQPVTGAAQLINGDPGVQNGDGVLVPKITSRIIYDSSVPPKPQSIEIKINWQPNVYQWDPFLGVGTKSKPLGDSHPLFDGLNASFTIDATIIKSLNPSAPGATYDINGVLQEITINLLPGGDNKGLVFIQIPLKRLQFHSHTGGKTFVSADLGAIQFLSILKFIQTLENIIPLDGFSDPPSIDVSPQGITASFSLGIPTIAVGAFSLQNLNLISKLKIPFIGDPARLRFSISEREHPFIITYLVFGGGGFFGIELGLDGVELLEGALEFGAAVAINIGVASGSGYAMAGIYFKLELDPNNTESPQLTGFFQEGGNLEILGLVNMSTVFYIGLTYDTSPNTNELYGQASLTVEVDVAFFHQSVTLGPIEKKIAGSSPPPGHFGKIDQNTPYMMSEEQWHEYIHAYA